MFEIKLKFIPKDLKSRFEKNPRIYIYTHNKPVNIGAIKPKGAWWAYVY